MNERILKKNSSIDVDMNGHLSLIGEQFYSTINMFKFIRILRITSTRTN